MGSFNRAVIYLLPVDIITFFIKNTMWKTKIICIFAHFCKVWVNRKQVDFHICFLCNNLLQMCCLSQRTWGKWEVIPIHSWERRDILTVFSCNCGFSSLILCYSLSSDSFLKVSYNVECETLSVSFSYFVTLKLTCWPGTWMGLSSMFDSVTSCMGDLKILIPQVMQIF